ncbi:MAG: DUF4136 domain-containing protein [Desulfobacterales bacterium]|nr:DUF4136 domain-containing protein [Desulfobacterales bacterium]
MSRIWVLVVGITLTGFVGCVEEPTVVLPTTLTDVRVSTTYDPEATFPKTGSFGFLHLQQEPEGALQIDFAQVDNRVREALNKHLTKKGYKYGQTEDFQYLVSYRVLLEPEYEMEILNPFDENWKAVAKMKDHAKGALVVKVHKMPSAKPVWIGIFDATVMLKDEQALTEAEKDERMSYIVNKLMGSFPPSK